MAICSDPLCTNRSDERAVVPLPQAVEESRATIQSLTLLLDGITAGDYLTWVREPEPIALGRELRELAIEARAPGDRITIALCWIGRPPEPRIAAAAAGFALTPEVRAVLTNASNAPAAVATGDLTGDVADVNAGRDGDRGARRINHLQRRNDQ